MNPASRLALELGQLRHVLPPAQFRSYCLALARHAPRVVRERTLVAADRAMRGTISFRLGQSEIRVPVDQTEKMLEAHDPTPTFGGAREMYAGNVYLRGFRDGLKAQSALDLGSNRGLFLLQAHKVLGATTLVGVEPQPFYAEVFEALAETNDVPKGSYTRYQRMIGAAPGPETITLAEIMERHGLEQIDFVKCDIEGGEFGVLTDPAMPLDRIGNIAMELHPEAGDPGQLVEVLERNGFDVVVTDQFDKPIPPANGHYLYASRLGDLRSRD